MVSWWSSFHCVEAPKLTSCFHAKPPFFPNALSYSPLTTAHAAIGAHAGSPNMLRQIDAVCKDVGVYPHAILSAHQHNYQRYTRSIALAGKEREVPFVVCGSGGHHLNPIVQGRRGEPVQKPRYGQKVDYMEVKPAVETPRPSPRKL
jgi:hypothetical protein